MTEAIFSYEPGKFAGFDELVEIALDLRWSWNHAADDIWRSLDPRLWDLTRNPWAILETASPQKIEQISADKDFRGRVESLARKLRESRTEESWFQRTFPDTPLGAVAYFSMEFMLGEALPIYSGGLGNVAGDQLKAASDLGVPVVGVGLLYQQGYFRQSIGADGSQSALYPYNDPGQLQITPARNSAGAWVRVAVKFGIHEVWLRAWQAQIGRVVLYLLDSNDPVNPPLSRGITSQLYGGGPNARICQEMVLGIGGWRLLRALKINPQVCHLNEGHSAFMVLERTADLMEVLNLPFEKALRITRAGNLFTTHTPVAAGFDRFPPELVQQFLGAYAEERLHISIGDLLALGRQSPRDEREPFNMAYLAARGCGSINAVSRLHAKVSREIFQPLFPHWPGDEVPVGHVTNGIHVPTWDSKAADELWTKQCGGARWIDDPMAVEQAIRETSDEALWAMRQQSRHALIEYVRFRYASQLVSSGEAPGKAEKPGSLLNPEALTLGFARRFAAYKRPTLLLHNPRRLVRILTNPEYPVQLILAGKAHPDDLEGQAMIREWIRFMERPEIRGHAVFLSDYDMLLTEQMVGGVDVWINTPRRPWEACGTSGMKVLVNGGLNLSELDGWWAEAYSPDVGWAIGDGREHDQDPGWDAAEAEDLYLILEKEVIPQFYRRDRNGIPGQWVAKVRESIGRLTPRFSAHRTVKEYTREWYLPAAAAYRKRTVNGGRDVVESCDRIRELRKNWDSVSFLDMKVETLGGQHYFSVKVDLGNVSPALVQVELYAEARGDRPFRQVMARGDRVSKAANVHIYTSKLPGVRPAADYTPRIIGHIPGVSIPLELNLILWQR